jgi:hypothetical protein
VAPVRLNRRPTGLDTLLSRSCGGWGRSRPHYAHRVLRRSLVVAFAAAALFGCGEDAERSGVLDPAFVLNAPGEGQAIVKVDSEAEGDRVCDEAKLGDYDELQGIDELIIKSPDADQGRNDDGTRCELSVK